MYATEEAYVNLVNTLTPAELTKFIAWAEEMRAAVAQQMVERQAHTGKVDPFLFEQQQELAALIERLGAEGLCK